MQNENSLFELYGVDSTIRSVGIVFDHLKYASAAKALKHLRRVMLTTPVVFLFILRFTGTFIAVCITAKWGDAVR